MKTGILGFLTIFLSLHFAQALEQVPQGKIPRGLLRLGNREGFSPYTLVVNKAKKTVHVFEDKGGSIGHVKSYEADLGKKAGPKHSLNDHRTPEGVYFLTSIIEAQQLDPIKYGKRAFVTDYPNLFDRLSGKTGYGIWLHAIDDKTGLERGSRGCVVVRNETILEIGSYIQINQTPLLIMDDIKWVTPEDNQKQLQSILQWVQKWKSAWESKDIETYIDQYAPEFRFGKMNLSTYRQYKAELALKYAQIQVQISYPMIVEHDDHYVIRFLQNYVAAEHSDFGEKTLYVKKDSKGFNIVGEFWTTQDQQKSRLLAEERLCCAALKNN
ncbi:MAG: L,D-transpeptidase family protein [Oligoflexia bacterium]|nr:L,D-transpeptidase family protein [Oligoflexia bacterium]